jgi:hypothetical protein
MTSVALVPEGRVIVTTALPKVRPLVLKRRAAAFDNPD